MPEIMRIARFVIRCSYGDRGPGIGLPGLALVVAVGEAGPRFRCGIDGDEDIFLPGLEPRSVVAVHHHAARKALPGNIDVRLERDRFLHPVKHVRADRMSPVHAVPAEPVGKVLERHVVFAFVIPETVDVIHPPVLCAEMELPTVRLVVICGQIRKFRIRRSAHSGMSHT